MASPCIISRHDVDYLLLVSSFVILLPVNETVDAACLAIFMTDGLRVGLTPTSFLQPIYPKNGLKDTSLIC